MTDGEPVTPPRHAGALSPEEIYQALRDEYVRHALMAAHPAGHPTEKRYHQGARDGIMLALTLLAERRQ